MTNSVNMRVFAESKRAVQNPDGPFANIGYQQTIIYKGMKTCIKVR